jgi:hypothetical protein
MIEFLNIALSAAMAAGFVSCAINMFLMLKGQVTIKNKLDEKYANQPNLSFPLLSFLSAYEAKRHFTEGTSEYDLALKQVRAKSRFIQSWLFIAACFVLLISAPYIVQVFNA